MAGFALLFFLPFSLCFNVDIDTHVLHVSDQAGSMFGFAVALHKDRGQSRLLVGAPKYDTEQSQRGVTHAGAVFMCSPQIQNQCNYVPFDRTGNNMHRGLQLDSKSGQWFGATLKSSGEDGVVVACAPRYTWYTENTTRREPVGTCYVARRGLTDFEEFSPCRTGKWGYHRQGSCQAGFDAAVSRDSNRLFIGAPGAFYWQGQCWATTLKVSYRIILDSTRDISNDNVCLNDTWQIHSQSLVIRQDYQMTWEGPATEDDQYLGYSVATGDFTGDGSPDVALGVPKGLNYTGRTNGLKKLIQSVSNSTQKAYSKRIQKSHESHFKSRVFATGDVNRFDFQARNNQIGSRNLTFWYSDLSRPSYAGYSLTTGEFDGRSGDDLVIGIPRGKDHNGNITGKIAIYTHDLLPLQNITGYQLGSYFGYSLAVVDFNGDGMEDLIVGAPMYTDFKDREMKFEVGRVHVLLQNANHQFKQVFTYNGEVNRGRFGLSVASLGDVDLDGYGDIAVGAPYGGPDGSGCVFIYHGFETKVGERVSEDYKKAAQVILASQVSRHLKTFGWSLSGGLDADDNFYPDLLIGSYESDSIILLKSRPIVNIVNSSVTFAMEKKSVNLENKECTITVGYEAPCFPLQLCMGYEGVGIRDSIRLQVNYTLDGKQNEPRIFFLKNRKNVFSEVLRLKKGSTLCQNHTVYVYPNLEDKLSPMTASVNYFLMEPVYSRSRRELLPILNKKQKLLLQDSVSIQKNCGTDDVCIPDLIVDVNVPDSFVLDKKEHLEVDTRVTNNGEDAFEASVYVSVPQGLLFSKFITKENTSVTCSPRVTGNRQSVKCDIGNPLPRREGVHFSLLFQVSKELQEPKFEFLVIANSTNLEAVHTTEDNTVRKTITVELDTKYFLYGISEPEQVEYNISIYSSEMKKIEEDVGPEIIHRYALDNKGSSDILEINLVILWPSRTISGNYLLYLMEQPILTNSVSCEHVNDVNPLSLRIVTDASRLSTHMLQLRKENEHTAKNVEGSESSSSNFAKTTHANYSSSSSSSYSSSTSYDSSSSHSKKHQSSSSSLNRITRNADPDVMWEKETNYCGEATLCTKIRCKAGPLQPDDIVFIDLRSRLWLQTLLELPYEHVSISSKMIARVSNLPHGVSTELSPIRTHNVSTPVSPTKSLSEAATVSWWWIVLAIILGILILLIIILICWKFGFFKRNRPQQRRAATHPEESQALNSPGGHHNSHNGHNGHQSCGRTYFPGDEAL